MRNKFKFCLNSVIIYKFVSQNVTADRIEHNLLCIEYLNMLMIMSSVETQMCYQQFIVLERERERDMVTVIQAKDK